MARSTAERWRSSLLQSFSPLRSSRGDRGTPGMLRAIPDPAERQDRRRWIGPRRQPKGLQGRPREPRADALPSSHGPRNVASRACFVSEGTAICPPTLEFASYPSRRTPMRTRKPSAWLRASVLLGLASHTAMGIAMGLAFAFVLTLIDAIGVMALINHRADPKTTMLVFVGSLTLAFGVGATLTGLVFMMMEEH